MNVGNIDTSRSYATEKNLMTALGRFPDAYRFMVVRNRDGRFTAVFASGSLQGDIAGVAGAGFMVFG